MMEEKLWYAVIYFAEALIAWQFFGALFPSRKSFWARCALYGAAYTVAYLSFTVSTVPINTLIFAVCNSAILFLGYQVKWMRAVLHALLLTGLMLSTEFLIAMLLGAVFQDFDKYQNDLVVLVLFSILSKLIFFFCTRLYVHIAKGKETEEPIPIPVIALLVLCCISSILVILFLFLLCLLVKTLPAFGGVLMISGGLGLLLVNILLFAGYQYMQQVNKDYREVLLLQQKNEADKDYYTALQEQYDGQRVLIHDIRHHLGVIKGMAEKGDLPAVAQYIGEAEQLPALQKQARYCANPVLNAIVVRYQEVCRKKGITLTADIRHASLDFLAPVDITALFGNLLENAVEAAEGSVDPYVEISVNPRESHGLVLVTITNTCKYLPVEEGEGRFISQKRKGNFHGIGLQSVKKTLKKYGGHIEFYYSQNPQAFHALVSFSAPDVGEGLPVVMRLSKKEKS